MPATIAEIATEITERGPSGLGFAARQFDDNSIEQVILNHDLKAYRNETEGVRRWLPRTPHVVYSDSDMCVFQLTTDEDRPLVYGDRDREAPAWWLLGRDPLRDSGLLLMEFPGNEVDSETAWTRASVLEALNLDSWQTLSTEQATELDVGERCRVCGRLAIERHDPDEWIEHHNESGIGIGWEDFEQYREPTATKLMSHLLTFEDAADLVRTFDPMREPREESSLLRETAYIPDDATMLTVSEHHRNRKLTFSEGVYVFRRIARCRHHTARYPQSATTSGYMQQLIG